MPACKRAPKEIVQEPVLLAQALSLAEGQGDLPALEKSLSAGMTSNSMAAVLGAPLGITYGSGGVSILGYSKPRLTATGRMQGMVITDLMLTFTNGLLSYWTYGYTPEMEQAPGTPWSDLPVAATNKAAGGISFSFASDVSFPGSRPIDTPDVPKAGYVSWVPDLEVTELHDVQSTPLPAVGGRQDGVRGGAGTVDRKRWRTPGGDDRDERRAAARGFRWSRPRDGTGGDDAADERHA